MAEVQRPVVPADTKPDNAKQCRDEHRQTTEGVIIQQQTSIFHPETIPRLCFREQKDLF